MLICNKANGVVLFRKYTTDGLALLFSGNFRPPRVYGFQSCLCIGFSSFTIFLGFYIQVFFLQKFVLYHPRPREKRSPSWRARPEFSCRVFPLFLIFCFFFVKILGTACALFFARGKIFFVFRFLYP